MIVVLVGLVGSYAALVVTAMLARPLTFAFVLLVATGFDILIERQFRPVVALLRRAQIGISHRAFAQVFLLLLLIAITDANRDMSRFQLLVISMVTLTIPVARIGYLGLLTLVRRRMAPPVEVRNVQVPEHLYPGQLPQTLTDEVTIRLMVLGLLPVLAGALSVWLDAFWVFGVTVGIYTAVVGVASLLLVRQLVLLGRRLRPQQVLDEVSKALRAHAPEVVLYFSGSPNELYQVEMWLDTLEKTSHPSMVLVRQRHAIQNLRRTSLPIVCIPRSVDLMNFALPDARIALYVANVGNNIHFLREPRIKHVFIGHGDSDKVGSFNPYSKVYDQIWVAGPAGRERYARAKVGVRDEAIVEVGRPQLDTLERRTGPLPAIGPTRPLTVLYLPTWEGWTDDRFQTSLTVMGAELVKALLGSSVPIRLIYKPHPLTGTRDAAAARADQEIRELVEAAAARLGELDTEAVAKLDMIASQLADPELPLVEAERLEAEWHAVYRRAYAGRHVVVTDRLPTLYECFNLADVLIADISSVVSDFLATGKPCVVANPKGLTDEEFRETFPSTRSAYLLSPGGDVGAIIDTIISDDPMALDREEARSYLLGPDEPSAQTRWNAAVDALIAAADAEWDGEHGAGPRRDDDREVVRPAVRA
ncbi:MAG TPA: hypothetical protein VIL34_02680 [Actinopolymorphaceae bacterium]|jgi:hypothetical protein